MGMPFCLAHVMLFVISPLMVPASTHWVVPLPSVAQRHGVTVKSWTQPSHWWV